MSSHAALSLIYAKYLVGLREAVDKLDLDFVFAIALQM